MKPQTPSLLMVLSLAACGHDGYSVRWTRLTETPAGARLESRSLSLPVETTIGARPTVLRDGKELPCAPGIESEDPDTLFVEPSERGAFVFIGVSPGTTVLVVFCGDAAFDVDGQVTD